MSKRHTNNLECYTAAEIFDELGYNVDVILYNNDIKIEKLDSYDVVYGFGKAYVKSLSNLNCASIYYGTGCSPIYQNLQTIAKGRIFNKKYKINCFNMLRYVSDDYTAIGYYSDAIIALGNKFSAKTYKLPGSSVDVSNLNAFYYDVTNIDINQKEIQTIKNNFLWFGSSGIVHKGLDLVLDVFNNRKDLNLTICGASKSELIESGLYNIIKANKHKNIRYIEWVDIESKDFRELMNTHIAIVFPSVSEGGSPAVINVMANGGLIPIISSGCSVDVDGLGMLLEEDTYECLEKNIDMLLSYNNEKLMELSKLVKDRSRAVYSYDKYRENLSNLIKHSLELYRRRNKP